MASPELNEDGGLDYYDPNPGEGDAWNPAG